MKVLERETKREREKEREMESFVEGSTEGEKVFYGRVFPKTLLPPTTTGSPSNLAEILGRERERISDYLRCHGAVLLRGFGLSSADEFAGVVAALGWDEFNYKGAVDRHVVADRVFTANESPPHIFINFHHEMALIKEFPAKILFFCVDPSPEGGETSIIRSDVVVERMEEELPLVVEKLEREGINFVLHRTSSVWNRLTGTQDTQQAHKYALESLACNSVSFNDDGSADFHYGPMNPLREFEGKRVWFNTIIGFVTEPTPLNATFGDGSPIPDYATNAFQRIMEENCVDIRWRKGDILLVNNRLVKHARRAGKPPRAVLVSLCN